MKRLTSMFAAAALASMSAGALAKDDAAEGVRDQARATYKADKKACNAFEGDERKNCERRAKAQYDQAVAEARRMKAEQKRERAAERADERDRKERLDVGSGGHRARGDSSYGSSRLSAPVTAGGAPEK